MNDNHQHIDELVRERLHTLPPATPPTGGWAALQRELDGDADLLLRTALTGLATAVPTGWEALERKMDPQTAADQQLADQLTGLKPAPPTGWDTLAARLDRETDKTVDAIVTDGLARTTPIVSSGWVALAARLELIGWRRSTVAAWKLTECCLLLSLLLLFVRFGPTTPSNPTFAELAKGFPLPLALAQNEGPSEKTIPARETGLNVPIDEAVEVAKPVAVALEAKQQPKQKATHGKATTRLASNKRFTTAGRGLSPLPESPDFLVQSQESLPILKEADVTWLREEVYLPDIVSVLTINKLKTRLYPPSPALILPKRDDTEPIYYYLNAFVSPVDLNHVVTPATESSVLDISSDNRITYGKSAGLFLDVIQGRSGLQLGFVYSRRSYIPTALKWWKEDEFTPTEPFFEGGYTRFVYDAVELQFNYKRTLLETEKWRFSGKVGMGINLVAYADFANQERFVQEFNEFLVEISNLPADPEDPNGGRDGNNRRDEAEEKQLKKPAAGFLEGGGVFDNSSLYFNGGIVVERLIDQRWSVYVAPSFGRAIYLRKDQGIGPYKDRINPAGIRFGSRYHFGGK